MIRGLWTELTVGVDPVLHSLSGVGELADAVFRTGAQRLFAGSSVTPFAGISSESPDHVSGAILRLGDEQRRIVGIYQLDWDSSARFGLGVVLADEDDWGRGVGMDAIIAVLHHAFYAQAAHTFAMAVGIHNRNTIRILGSGQIRPETLAKASIADGAVLRELALGTMTVTDFRVAGYRPPALDAPLWAESAPKIATEVIS